MNPPTVLIVEDDDFQYEIYEEALSKYKLVRVTNGKPRRWPGFPRSGRTCWYWTTCSPMEKLGLDFLPEFKELLPFVPIVIVSGALEVHQQLNAAAGSEAGALTS